MLKYVKNIGYITYQIETNACVPIAVCNALRWKGANVPFRMVREHVLPLGFCPKRGANDDNITRMLHYFDLKHHLVENVSVPDIERYLGMGYGVLLAYSWFMPEMRPWRKMRCHLAFVDGHSGQFFNVINANGNGAEYKPTLEKYFAKAKSYRGRGLYPKVWLIE